MKFIVFLLINTALVAAQANEFRVHADADGVPYILQPVESPFRSLNIWLLAEHKTNALKLDAVGIKKWILPRECLGKMIIIFGLRENNGFYSKPIRLPLVEHQRTQDRFIHERSIPQLVAFPAPISGPVVQLIGARNAEVVFVAVGSGKTFITSCRDGVIFDHPIDRGVYLLIARENGVEKNVKVIIN